MGKNASRNLTLQSLINPSFSTVEETAFAEREKVSAGLYDLLIKYITLFSSVMDGSSSHLCPDPVYTSSAFDAIFRLNLLRGGNTGCRGDSSINSSLPVDLPAFWTEHGTVTAKVLLSKSGVT
jgi:hypothetical protein